MDNKEKSQFKNTGPADLYNKENTKDSVNSKQLFESLPSTSKNLLIENHRFNNNSKNNIEPNPGFRNFSMSNEPDTVDNSDKLQQAYKNFQIDIDNPEILSLTQFPGQNVKQVFKEHNSATTTRSESSKQNFMKNSTLANHTTQASDNSGDKFDYDTFQDVMGYVGVDLKQENDNIFNQTQNNLATYGKFVDFTQPQQINTFNTKELLQAVRSQPFDNCTVLINRISLLITNNNLKSADEDVFSFLGLALENILTHIIEESIKTIIAKKKYYELPEYIENNKKHGLEISYLKDTKRQLRIYEKTDEEVDRQFKQYLIDRESISNIRDLSKGRKKSKEKQKLSGMSIERNLSDDVRKKIMNQTAFISAGGVKKSWMMPNLSTLEEASVSSSLNDPSSIIAQSDIRRPVKTENYKENHIKEITNNNIIDFDDVISVLENETNGTYGTKSKTYKNTLYRAFLKLRRQK